MEEYFKRLYAASFNDFCECLNKRIAQKERTFIVTANPETFWMGQSDKEINTILLDPKVTLVPDGISIVKSAHMLDIAIKERITGCDLADYLLKYAGKKGLKIALLGAKEEVITKLVEKIKSDYPAAQVVYAENGYTPDKDAFFQKIKKLEPDIVLVALGIPVQEKLIYQHLKEFKKGIFMGVGGSFDVLSGSKKRAPKVFIKLHLEWLYRLLCEPKRIKRFYDNNIKFMAHILKLKKAKNKTK